MTPAGARSFPLRLSATETITVADCLLLHNSNVQLSARWREMLRLLLACVPAVDSERAGGCQLLLMPDATVDIATLHTHGRTFGLCESTGEDVGCAVLDIYGWGAEPHVPWPYAYIYGCVQPYGQWSVQQSTGNSQGEGDHTAPTSTGRRSLRSTLEATGLLAIERDQEGDNLCSRACAPMVAGAVRQTRPIASLYRPRGRRPTYLGGNCVIIGVAGHRPDPGAGPCQLCPSAAHRAPAAGCTTNSVPQVKPESPQSLVYRRAPNGSFRAGTPFPASAVPAIAANLSECWQPYSWTTSSTWFHRRVLSHLAARLLACRQRAGTIHDMSSRATSHPSGWLHEQNSKVVRASGCTHRGERYAATRRRALPSCRRRHQLWILYTDERGSVSWRCNTSTRLAKIQAFSFPLGVL